VWLSHGVQVAGAAWRAATRIMVEVGDLVPRIRVGRTGRVTPCVVHTVQLETRNMGFLVEPQHHGRRFVSGFTSKPLGRFVSGFTSKPLGLFSPVWPQNRWQRFLQFGLKIGGREFPGLGFKTSNYGLVICDETMTPHIDHSKYSQLYPNTPADNYLKTSSILFGSPQFEESMSKEIFTNVGLSSKLSFESIHMFKKREEKMKKQYIRIGSIIVMIEDAG
jgi:hypothetical protein